MFTTGSGYVLSLTLGDEAIVEQPDRGGIMALVQGHPKSVHMLIDGINHAADDKQVKGILLTLEGNILKTAVVQELRDAFKAFKAKGKFIYTYTDSFGELSNGTVNYYLAAATTKIWMMPLGTLNFNGLMIEIPFARKALDDFKIRPQIGRREEYKGFIESLTESDFTLPYKENMQRVINALTSQIVTDVAADRGLDSGEVRKILDASPYSPKAAVVAKMIDEIGYKDQVKEAIEKIVGKKVTYYSFDSYAQAIKEPSSADNIAIIYAEGSISKAKSTKSPLSEEMVMDAPEIAKSIREAREDDSIKAIIMRIDSGGGNPIASEMIGREMELTKPKKPVIVTMSNFAASGGYWIACNARKIVAQPSTVTGSIGFYAGKIVTQEFWDHYGIHWGEIHSGDNAAIWSTSQLYTEKGRQKFNEYLDQIYDIFQDKVVNGRGLSREKVRQIAKGQVWTGVEAKEHGLIDALGGLTTALTLAKQEAGLRADAPVNLISFPSQKSFLSMMFTRNNESDTGILARYPSLQMVLKHIDAALAPPHIDLKIETIKP
jgi:protease-4